MGELGPTLDVLVALIIEGREEGLELGGIDAVVRHFGSPSALVTKSRMLQNQQRGEVHPASQISVIKNF